MNLIDTLYPIVMVVYSKLLPHYNKFRKHWRKTETISIPYLPIDLLAKYVKIVFAHCETNETLAVIHGLKNSML